MSRPSAVEAKTEAQIEANRRHHFNKDMSKAGFRLDPGNTAIAQTWRRAIDNETQLVLRVDFSGDSATKSATRNAGRAAIFYPIDDEGRVTHCAPADNASVTSLESPNGRFKMTVEPAVPKQS